MNGDKKVVQYLNAQLKNELTAINQYFLHARIYRHWGLQRIADLEYQESIGEMKHADRLIDRILLLGGLPNLQDLGKLLIGQDTREILECDLNLEKAARTTVIEAVACCEAAKDYLSRELFIEILNDTEAHIDWLQTQLELIGRIGLQNYLQAQMASRDA